MVEGVGLDLDCARELGHDKVHLAEVRWASLRAQGLKVRHSQLAPRLVQPWLNQQLELATSPKLKKGVEVAILAKNMLSWWCLLGW